MRQRPVPEEADWVERSRENMRGRTVMIITHRFTTAIWADNIHVMMDGKIIESGTHAGLIEMNGLYAGSWGKQVAGYRLKVEDSGRRRSAAAIPIKLTLIGIFEANVSG